MRYMLLIYEDERIYGPDRDNPAARERRAQHIAYSRELGATRLAGSGLLDGAGHAAALGALLRGLWRERCRG